MLYIIIIKVTTENNILMTDIILKLHYTIFIMFNGNSNVFNYKIKAALTE